jgi:transformation/transcription domain-associated protein
MALLMQIIRTDNEENAVLSLKIMIDLHRNYKTVVADQVQPFLDFVFEMYASMPAIVKEAFDTNSSVVAATPAATVYNPPLTPEPPPCEACSLWVARVQSETGECNG